ncbi:MAG: TRAP-type C4-dicarboxylate transport system, small permease component [Microvirga sp.]|jgi:TRAP-type C4-dicarboxylate transport system permease small subunit|nr:TRAP-type C4-dicarboxylate transport system, small permease component [Microvirga sp.]
MSFLVRYVVAAMYALLVIVGTAQVLSRYAFGMSLAWSEELIRYTFFWSVMLTAAVIAGEGGHLKVDYVSDRLSPPLRRTLQFFNDILFFVFSAALLVLGGDLVWRAVEGGSRSPAMGISMGWVYLAFPVGGLLLIGMHVRYCLRSRRDGQ